MQGSIGLGDANKDSVAKTVEGTWYEACSTLPIHQEPLSVDKATFFDSIELNEEAHLTPEDNMKGFIKNYGVELKTPALFVKDSKIYPLKPMYLMQMVDYECKTDPEQRV